MFEIFICNAHLKQPKQKLMLGKKNQLKEITENEHKLKVY